MHAANSITDNQKIIQQRIVGKNEREEENLEGKSKEGREEEVGEQRACQWPSRIRLQARGGAREESGTRGRKFSQA